MKAPAWFLVLIFLVPLHIAAQTPSPDESFNDLVRVAEKEFYGVEHPDRFAREAATLGLMVKLYPNEPYVWWAKARLAFFQKENFYVMDRDDLEPQKMALGEICHENADKCLKIAPDNAECHLLKGSCYAMQASTWGNSFKSLRIVSPMDREWAKAMELPSTFQHPEGTTTRQLAMILRGCLHRILPDSFWFRLIAGVRGSKERAYRWLDEAVAGAIAREPMVVMEKVAVMLCLAHQKKRPELKPKALDLLREALQLPTRYPLDDFDKRNMRILLDQPEKACSYSRVAFRDFSEGTLKKDIPAGQR
jgi:hypothetical protein